jgi:hypothetical protein
MVENRRKRSKRPARLRGGTFRRSTSRKKRQPPPQNAAKSQKMGSTVSPSFSVQLAQMLAQPTSQINATWFEFRPPEVRRRGRERLGGRLAVTATGSPATPDAESRHFRLRPALLEHRDGKRLVFRFGVVEMLQRRPCSTLL